MAECLSDPDFDDDESFASISNTNVSLEDILEIDDDPRKNIGGATNDGLVKVDKNQILTKHTLVQDKGKQAHTTTFDSAALGKSSIEIELFDSGASRHMSGYHHHFINFVEIQPKPITAADKRQFFANGKGDMYLEVLNGNGHSRILLRDILYSPIMGITLVSIGQITSAGSSVLFHGDTCQIYSPSKTLLAQIPKRGGLYQNYNPRSTDTGYTRKVKELLTIDELHRRLGHVRSTHHSPQIPHEIPVIYW